ALLDGQGVAFAGGAADEGGADAMAEEVLDLPLDDAEVQFAVGAKGGVGRGDEPLAFKVQGVGSPGLGSGRGRISRTRATEAIAVAANRLKMTLSGTCRSRSQPKPQSARPPQPMLTRFMIP